MAKPDIDELAQLPTEEREDRIQAAAERIETRIERARDHSRDLTEREVKLSEDDRAELEALKAATTIAEHAERRGKELAKAMDTTPRPEQRAALADFITEVAAGRPVRMAIESRSITTAVAGARGGVAVNGIGRPGMAVHRRFDPVLPGERTHRQRPALRRPGRSEPPQRKAPRNRRWPTRRWPPPSWSRSPSSPPCPTRCCGSVSDAESGHRTARIRIRVLRERGVRSSARNRSRNTTHLLDQRHPDGRSWHRDSVGCDRRKTHRVDSEPRRLSSLG